MDDDVIISYKIPCFSIEQITKKQFIQPLDYIEMKGNDFFAILKIGPYIQTLDNCYVYMIHILPFSSNLYACFPTRIVQTTYLKSEFPDATQGIIGRWCMKNKYLEFINLLKDHKNFEKQENKLLKECYKNYKF